MVYFFKDCTQDKLPEIGYKSLRLASLFNAGVNVPLGFVIPRTILWKGFDEETEEDIVDSYLSLSAHEGMSTANLLKNDECYVAVRNSFVDDAPDLGQMAILNVKGKKKLLQAIKDCYRQSREIAQKNIRKPDSSIIIQKMVDAEKSGTAYSSSDNLIIEAFFGLGTGLELGKIHPDTYILDKETLSLKSFNIAQKVVEAARDIDTDEIIIQELGIKSGRQVLMQKEIEEVARQWKKTSSVLGEQKIGWSIKDNIVYVLQTRITKDDRVEMEVSEEEKEPEMIDLEENIQNESGEVPIQETSRNDAFDINETESPPLINSSLPQTDDFLGMAMFANDNQLQQQEKKEAVINPVQTPINIREETPNVKEEFIVQDITEKQSHPMKNMILANAGNIIVYTHLMLKDQLKERLTKYNVAVPDSLSMMLDMLLEFESVKDAEQIRNVDKAKANLMNGRYPSSDDLMNAMRLV